MAVKKKGMIEIKFQVGTSDLTIKKAFHCNHESLVVFVLSNLANEHIFVVWDLERNSEVNNFSTKGNYRYVLGENSNSGYLLQNKSYVNLDNCMPYSFIDYDFTTERKPICYSLVYKGDDGYKINRTGGFCPRCS